MLKYKLFYYLHQHHSYTTSWTYNVTRSCLYKLNNNGYKGYPCFRLVLTLICGNSIIHYANYYTYLGLVLNEFLDYSITATVVDTSANRALGLVIDKCKLLSGIAYLVILCIYKIIW
jgi:hypothetical protein